MIPDESSVHAVLAVNETFVVYVDPGESLSQLAARHGVTLEQLQQWNGIENPDYVQAGQRIVVHEAAVPYLADARRCLHELGGVPPLHRLLHSRRFESTPDAREDGGDQGRDCRGRRSRDRGISRQTC